MRRRAWLAVSSGFIGLASTVLGLELVLQFLPVASGLKTEPVTQARPVFHFHPDREVTVSHGWDLRHVNRLRINNAGFVNPIDYAPDATTPLLAVIGDSYIEALILPPEQTLQARLARRVADRGRIYSFAASGAPLSQYLIWAEHASTRYGAGGAVFLVVGNDFDESLASYARQPGFHHFVEEGSTLGLRLTEYHPHPLRELGYVSALGRYLLNNLGARSLPARLRARWRQWSEGDGAYVGNTDATPAASRLADSRRAVDAFLDLLPLRTAWTPAQVLFLLDGLRVYDEGTRARARRSYFGEMRAYFIERARRQGFAVVDMDPIFAERHRADGSRFEFSDDAHWNSLAHELAAEAVARSHLFERLFDRPAPDRVTALKARSFRCVGPPPERAPGWRPGDPPSCAARSSYPSRGESRSAGRSER